MGVCPHRPQHRDNFGFRTITMHPTHFSPASHGLPKGMVPAAPPVATLRNTRLDHRKLYDALNRPAPGADARLRGAQFLERLLQANRHQPASLPDTPEGLHEWMTSSAERVAQDYARYLAGRKQGHGRSYFPTRSHALHFLQAAAPTKLVDGSWLYGALGFSGNPRMLPLVRTYLEELGNGDPAQNHVVLYQRLLAENGLEQSLPKDDALYIQGLTQLALGWNADEFLPEIIGFNLGYEQLPLHLLITAYELNELGIDPYYFTLHVTVDNHSTGHARAACDAVQALMPRYADATDFWRRVRAGALLGDAGVGTNEIVGHFDLEEEVLRILQDKAPAGAGMHSDYCRIGGRTVNEWLATPADIPQFLNALVSAGWIRRDEAPETSRFWRLLHGDHAAMFGVFSAYEMQVLYDWIRGSSGGDGAAWTESAAGEGAHRRPSYRALQQARQRSAQSASPDNAGGSVTPVVDQDLGDPDLPAFEEMLATLPATARRQALVKAMSPAEHWTPVGLRATRLFLQEAL